MYLVSIYLNFMSHRKVSSKTGSRTTECPRAKMTYFKLHSSGGSCVSQATVIEMNGTLMDSFLLTQKIRVIHHWNKSLFVHKRSALVSSDHLQSKCLYRPVYSQITCLAQCHSTCSFIYSDSHYQLALCKGIFVQ